MKMPTYENVKTFAHNHGIKVAVTTGAAMTALSQTGAAAYSVNWTDGVQAGFALVGSAIGTLETEPFLGIVLGFVFVSILMLIFRNLKR